MQLFLSMQNNNLPLNLEIAALPLELEKNLPLPHVSLLDLPRSNDLHEVSPRGKINSFPLAKVLEYLAQSSFVIFLHFILVDWLPDDHKQFICLLKVIIISLSHQFN